MRKTTNLIVAVAVALAAALAAAAAAQTAAAKARLDTSFGSHHGYWVRTDGLWADPTALTAVARGTGIVVGQRARFARIGARGTPERSWGRAGVLDMGASRFGRDAVRWNGHYVLTANHNPARRAVRVVDPRGRILRRLTAAVQATMAPAASKSTGFIEELLAPGPDGRLWNLRTQDGRTSRSARRSLLVLDGAGVPETRARRAVRVAHGVVDAGVALATRAGLIVAVHEPGGAARTVRRLRRDGSVDRRFRAVRLTSYSAVTQMLPWRGGAIVVEDGGAVHWVTSTGRVVRRWRFDYQGSVALDAAGRLIVLDGREDLKSLTVRRFRRDGTQDKAFGTVRLKAGNRFVEGLGVIPAPHGRVLVAGRAVVVEGGIREDFIPHGTVVWRIRTR